MWLSGVDRSTDQESEEDFAKKLKTKTTSFVYCVGTKNLIRIRGEGLCTLLRERRGEGLMMRRSGRGVGKKRYWFAVVQNENDGGGFQRAEEYTVRGELRGRWEG